MESSRAAAIAEARSRLGRPLALAEKILATHLDASDPGTLRRGEDTLALLPDRVALQDATAQMALLQFMLAGLDRVAVPSSVHCDHLISARDGGSDDLERALGAHAEVYGFLKAASARYGLEFWRPGAGIIHQVVLESYACPGGLMVGTDSHTPNAGGLGMCAIGVGGADAVDVMAGQPWGLLCPRIIGVRLTGSMDGWTAAKDVILKLAGILTVSGGTGAIIEYFGEGAASVPCTGKATITNMGAEIGATCSVFPFDAAMGDYLRCTGRAEAAAAAEAEAADLRADPEVEDNPDRHYDRVIEIDLSALEPHWVGPYTPDLARPVSNLSDEAEREQWPTDLSAALIGSCTNSSYEDIGRAAHLARQAADAGHRVRTRLFISPGSARVQATMERDGLLEPLVQAGATVLANACGPCIGQWERTDGTAGTTNTIVTSFNRNFRKRNDGNPETLAFIGSPEMVMAAALSGRLDFDPATDSIALEDGSGLRLSAPAADTLPEGGFAQPEDDGRTLPPENGRDVSVPVDPASKRLQLLEPFPAWDGEDLAELPILLKARGKCTTDHISPAGPWLRYRGHLEKISENMFSGAVNDLNGGTGTGTCPLTSAEDEPLHVIGSRMRQANRGWAVVGDENYGEGSSREHAAMSPRFLGCRLVLVRSYARIAETNLKKQGVLPCVFAEGSDYDLVRAGDSISVLGLSGLEVDVPLDLVLHHSDGTTEGIKAEHSLDEQQIGWFRAGSAINAFRA